MDFNNLAAIVDGDVGIDASVVGDGVLSGVPDDVEFAGSGIFEMTETIVQFRDATVLALVNKCDLTAAVDCHGGMEAVAEGLCLDVPLNILINAAAQIDLADPINDLADDLRSGRVDEDDIAFLGDGDGGPFAVHVDVVALSPGDDVSAGPLCDETTDVIPHLAAAITLMELDDVVAVLGYGD